jgi:hypothetical protein
MEEGIEAVLRTIREESQALLSEMGIAPPDLLAIAEHAEEAGRGARALLPRWKRLERESPYVHGAIAEAIALLGAIVTACETAGPEIAEAVGLEMEYADLREVEAALSAANLIKSARGARSMRSIAREANVSPGHLSEIEAGRAGLMTEEVCSRLDAVLGTDLVGHLSVPRAGAANLRDRVRQRRERRSRTARRQVAIGPRENVRLQRVGAALAGNADLLATTELLSMLPEGARLGVQKLIEALSDMFADDQAN